MLEAHVFEVCYEPLSVTGTGRPEFSEVLVALCVLLLHGPLDDDPTV